MKVCTLQSTVFRNNLLESPFG